MVRTTRSCRTKAEKVFVISVRVCVSVVFSLLYLFGEPELFICCYDWSMFKERTRILQDINKALLQITGSADRIVAESNSNSSPGNS